MAALDARHVDEARRAADQRAARERQLRHRLIAALGDGARAVGQALAALEGAADQRMGLEALEFLERRQIRIGVVEMDDEADRNQIVVEVIEERAAAGANCRAASRTSAAPARACACPARPARAPSSRCRISAARGPRPSPYFAISCFDRLPRAPSANSVYLARSSMPRVKLALRLAVLADAHVAGGDAGHRAALVVQHLGGGKARIDFDAQRLGLGREPAADVAERDDEVAVVRHQRRHQEIRQPQRRRLAEPVEAVVGDRGLDRGVLGRAIPAAAGRARSDRSPRPTGYARRPRSPSRPRPRRVRATAA